MIKTIIKVNSKWILLFLFMFLGVGVQAQYGEGGPNYNYSGGWDAYFENQQLQDEYARWADEVWNTMYDYGYRGEMPTMYLAPRYIHLYYNNGYTSNYWPDWSDWENYNDGGVEWTMWGGTGGQYNPPQIPVWYLDYDGDGYHGEAHQQVDSPGNKWSLISFGNDCDDTRPQYTTVCCTKTCESGYKLHIDSCECEKDCKKEEYEQAIRDDKIIFTKKYGWVDMTHAFLDTSRESPIGVNNLWNQLKEPPSASQIYMGYYSVNYKQDVVVAGVSIGIERQFLVSPDLTLEERKSVALAILQNVSTAFELLQSVHPTSTSSFEPADLPSNMLNFYRHVEGLTKEQILAAIEQVSIEQALEVLRLYPCTFASDEYKNRSFEPFRFESPYTSQNFGVPDILNTIVPFKVSPSTDFGNADLILLEQDIISD